VNTPCALHPHRRSLLAAALLATGLSGGPATAGLTADGNQFWHQGVAGVPDSAEAADELGFAVVGADFDGDGFVDLAIGVPGEDTGTDSDAGAVHVLFGSPDGLDTPGNQLLDQDSIDGDQRESADAFGTALAAGDFDDDGFADLVIGVPGEDDETGAVDDAGAIHVVPGGAAGLEEDDAVWLFQGSAGMRDQPETGDLFGAVLAVGDFDQDGFDDLAVGIPQEGIGGRGGGEGAVQVLYGGAGGLSTVGNQFWSQESPGIPDSAEGGDLFGSALASGDFDRDGFDDLAIGTPGESLGAAGELAGAGLVHILYGGAGGLSATDTQTWSQGSPGMQGDLEASDAFGASLAAADFDRDGYSDLAVGAPEESLGAAASAGAVHVLFGSATGISAAGNQLWTQNSSGVDDTAETDDRFGVTLAAGDFNGDTAADLAIGVQETLGAATHAGAVHVLYGRGMQGPQTDGAELWHQDSPGIDDVAEVGDFFGDSLSSGSFDGDRFDELAVGVPSEALSTTQDVGAVAVLFGEEEELFADGFESGNTAAWADVQN
jgi:hypothetical protein